MVSLISSSIRASTATRTSANQFSRSLSSSCSCSSSSSSLSPRQKSRVHQSLKTDSLLRSAISLYHLAPSFYPVTSTSSTSKPASSSPTSSTQLSLSLTSRVNSDILSRFLQTRSTSAISYKDANNLNSGNFKFNFPSLSQSQNAYDRQKRSTVKDGFTVGSTANNSNKFNQNHDFYEMFPMSKTPSTSTSSATNSSSTSSSSSTPSPLPSSTSQLLRTRQQFPTRNILTSSPVSSNPQIRILTSQTLVPGSHSINVSGSAGNGLGLNNLDERGSRIRDALFGTISGGLPGLEIVRERKEKRERRKRQEEMEGTQS